MRVERQVYCFGPGGHPAGAFGGIDRVHGFQGESTGAALTADEVRALREREGASQALFARY